MDADAACRLHEQALAHLAAGEYEEAEVSLRQALGIFEATDGPAHPDVANVLCGLASVLLVTRRDHEAEECARRALAIASGVLEEHQGELDDEVTEAVERIHGEALAQVACALRAQGRFAEAEPFAQQAAADAERVFGPDHPETSSQLNNLGVLYKYWGRYDDAERAYGRALSILDSHPDADELAFACLEYNLGGLAHARGEYEKAEPHARRSLEMRERLLGAEHPEVAVNLGTLAAILEGQERFAEAKALYLRALAILERAFGPEHPDIALDLANLGAVEEAVGNRDEAESLYRRSLEMREKLLGDDHPQVATSLNNLGLLLATKGETGDAARLLERALRIYEQRCGDDHPSTIACRANLAGVDPETPR